MLILIAVISAATLAVLIHIAPEGYEDSAGFHYGRPPHRCIRGEQEQEAVAGKLGAAELSVPHAQPTAPVGARNHA